MSLLKKKNEKLSPVRCAGARFKSPLTRHNKELSVKGSLKTGYKAIEKGVVSGYKAVEKGVVSSYKAVENGVVSAYKAVEDKFVDTFLSSERETSDEQGNPN